MRSALTLVTLAAATLLPALAGAQQLEYQSALSGTTGGLGTVLTVLTLNNTNNVSSGCVTPSGTSGCGFVDNTVQQSSTTRLISEIGGNSATLGQDLRFVANFSEPQNDRDGATVNNLQLQLFNAAGMAVFTGMLGSNGPVAFANTEPGIGNIGFAFGLTASGATGFQSALNALGTTTGARIGLGASLGDVQGGLDSFFVTRLNTPMSAVPEPSTYALMATGLLSVAGIARRRRSA